MSNITKEEFKNIQIDPSASVGIVLDRLSQADPEILVVDPSNPFAFMLETIAFNASVIRDEINTKYARLYPKLANRDTDLYNNISYKDTKNIFSQPAYAVIRFVVNLVSFNNVAISRDGYKRVSIPEMSYITVEGYDFLVTNRLNITQYDNGTFSVEQEVSSLDIGVSTLGVLEHRVVSTEDNNKMLIFDTVLKQVTRSSFSFTINMTDSFVRTVDLVDRLHFITAELNQGAGITVPVEVSYSEVIDAAVPTIIVKVLDKQLEITVPDIYILNGLVSGKLNINIFTTRGVVDYPLNKLPSNKFILTYEGVEKDEFTAVIKNVQMMVTSPNRLLGGSNGKTFEDLRESIINNSMGNSINPVTSEQVLDLVSKNGYYGYLLEDTLTSRLFMASKTISIANKTSASKANPDVMYYRASVEPYKLLNHPMIKVTDTSDDRLIIRQFTPFKNDNGLITPLTKDELFELENLGRSDKIKTLNSMEILFTPYSYISSVDNGVYNLRVVDFRPVKQGFIIESMNNSVLAKANIKDYSIDIIDTGYRIRIKMVSNGEFDQLDPSTIMAQLKVATYKNPNIFIYFKAHYNKGEFVFHIDTDFYVDKDLGLEITNGESELATKLIDLTNTFELITYTTDGTMEGLDVFGESLINGLETPATVISIEKLNMQLGKHLTFINNNMIISYTDRKYKRYDEVIYATYDKNVYETDDVGGLLLVNEDNTEVSYNIIHHKGDLILDDNGDSIVKHNIGDIMLDPDGTPIIDTEYGMIKLIDMVVLEYSNKLVDPDSVYDLMDGLDTVYLDMKMYQDSLLEETEIKFKPFINSRPVKVKYGTSFSSIATIIKPEVELFIETAVNINEEAMIRLRNQVGEIIHNYINKEVFYIADIKSDIQETVEIPVTAVRVNLDRTNQTVLSKLEKVILLDVTNRLRLGKKLVSTLGELSLLYDVDVKITKI